MKINKQGQAPYNFNLSRIKDFRFLPKLLKKRDRPNYRSTTMPLRRIFLVTCTVFIFFGCQSGKRSTTLDDIWGTWRTSSPKYSDRFLELTENSIVLGMGNQNVDVHPFKKIERVHEDDGILYTITHANREGQEYTLSFYYAPDRDGVIRFKNQSLIEWTRVRH